MLVAPFCRAHGRIDAFYAQHASKLTGSFSQLTYDDSMECSFSTGSIDAAGGSSKSPFEQRQGGPDAVEVWYDSGCYFRAPPSLSPEQLRTAADVVLEAGAVTNPDGSNSSRADAGATIVRWLLCYKSEGDRRLKWARNEVYTAA